MVSEVRVSFIIGNWPPLLLDFKVDFFMCRLSLKNSWLHSLPNSAFIISLTQPQIHCFFHNLLNGLRITAEDIDIENLLFFQIVVDIGDPFLILNGAVMVDLLVLSLLPRVLLLEFSSIASN